MRGHTIEKVSNLQSIQWVTLESGIHWSLVGIYSGIENILGVLFVSIKDDEIKVASDMTKIKVKNQRTKSLSEEIKTNLKFQRKGCHRFGSQPPFVRTIRSDNRSSIS